MIDVLDIYGFIEFIFSLSSYLTYMIDDLPTIGRLSVITCGVRRS